MKRVIFVGEEPSALALKMGVTWEDGRLAAKQLFDGFQAIGFDPSEAEFINLFNKGREDQRVLSLLKSADMPIVAMGRKVQKSLDRHDIKYIPIVHPAARGKIRKKERYISHLREKLEMLSL
tara:strand:+ start:62 stop:427 length:366 start_codon:yes stop_codon:yes gene_type:complete